MDFGSGDDGHGEGRISLLLLVVLLTVPLLGGVGVLVMAIVSAFVS